MPSPSDARSALASGSVEARRAAAEHLARAGEGAASAAVELVRACADTDDQVREWAVAALEGLGTPASALLPDLAALLPAPSPLTAYWAATLIGRLGAAGAPATAAVAARLASPGDLSVRQRAAWALGKIGPGAAAARDALRAATAAPDERLARLAVDALAAIGG